jgi:hypothetical protein
MSILRVYYGYNAQLWVIHSIFCDVVTNYAYQNISLVIIPFEISNTQLTNREPSPPLATTATQWRDGSKTVGRTTTTPSTSGCKEQKTNSCRQTSVEAERPCRRPKSAARHAQSSHAPAAGASPRAGSEPDRPSHPAWEAKFTFLYTGSVLLWTSQWFRCQHYCPSKIKG